MIMRALHQFLAGFAYGDAQSNEALLLQRIFRRWGLRSEIFCERSRIMRRVAHLARPLESYRPGEGDGVLLHLAIGALANDRFPSVPGPKVILYHNITPPEYLRGVSEEIAGQLRRGREDLERLRNSADIVLADSEFNARELRGLGYADPRVFPLALDLSSFRRRPDPSVRRRFPRDKATWLFVGRVVPNKRHDDLLRAFAMYRRRVRPASRLVIVGSAGGTERYLSYLRAMARRLDIHDDVHFEGTVSFAELVGHYRNADVFVCLSEHEGFGGPLMEAMAVDLPVIARAAGAVPETLAGAGILVAEPDPALVAELADRVLTDPALRAAVVLTQNRRVAAFLKRDLEAEIRGHLAPLLG